MSKSVRLPEYLAAEVQRLADGEKRSLANMVQVLLEQALRMDELPITVEHDLSQPPVVAKLQVSSTPRAQRASRDVDVEPDFK